MLRGLAQYGTRGSLGEEALQRSWGSVILRPPIVGCLFERPQCRPAVVSSRKPGAQEAMKVIYGAALTSPPPSPANGLGFKV